ncbi:MAG: MerR family transcriptional regulator [Gaiellaceae bacterium]
MNRTSSLRPTGESAGVRIGELSRRSGASRDVLRVWERRYGLLRPTRLANGYRVYSAMDVERAIEMQAHLARGVAPAQAAELVVAGGDGEHAAAPFGAPALLARLSAALAAYDGGGAVQLLDRALLNLGLAETIVQVVLPCLRDVGRKWECGEISVAQEHFATDVLRRRLLSRAGGWEGDGDRVALLACAPGEQHDVGLVCFGLALNSYHGWGITYLGADTPLPHLTDAARRIRPDLVAVSTVSPARFFPELTRWRDLAREAQLAIGGAGAHARLARKMGAAMLGGDPVVAAKRAAA